MFFLKRDGTVNTPVCILSKSDRLPSFSGMGRGSEWLWMVMPGRREGEQLTALQGR